MASSFLQPRLYKREYFSLLQSFSMQMPQEFEPSSPKIIHSWRWARYRPRIRGDKAIADSGQRYFYLPEEAADDAARSNSHDVENIILFRECWPIPKASRLLLYAFAHLIDRDIKTTARFHCHGCRFGIVNDTAHLVLLPPNGEEQGCQMSLVSARSKYLDEVLDNMTEDKLRDFYMQTRKYLDMYYSFECDFSFLTYVRLRYSVSEIPLSDQIPARLRDVFCHLCPY